MNSLALFNTGQAAEYGLFSSARYTSSSGWSQDNSVAFATLPIDNNWTISASGVWIAVLKCQSVQSPVYLCDWLRWQSVKLKIQDKVWTDSVGRDFSVLLVWPESQTLCFTVKMLSPSFIFNVKMQSSSKNPGTWNVKSISMAAAWPQAAHFCLKCLWSLMAAWKTEKDFCWNLERWMCEIGGLKLEPSVCQAGLRICCSAMCVKPRG